MQFLRAQDHPCFAEINKVIYIYFVGMTGIFVRPDRSKLYGMTPEGVVQYWFIHIGKLDHKKIHSRWCEIECHRAGADIWVRPYEDHDVKRSLDELTQQTGVDVRQSDCYYATMQVNFYMPKGEGLAKLEAERFHQAIDDGLKNGAVALENYRILKAARGAWIDDSGKSTGWLEGYDFIHADYHILLADVDQTRS